MALQQSKKSSAADDSGLEKKVAELKRSLDALSKKCEGLEKEIKECKAQCSVKAAAPASTSSGISIREFKIWQKKVAKKLGIRL